MEGISEAIMAEVMTDCSNQESHCVNVIKFGKLRKSALSQKEVRHMRHVNAMQVIVVLDVTSIGLLNEAQKFREFRLIDVLNKLMLKKHVYSEDW